MYKMLPSTSDPSLTTLELLARNVVGTNWKRTRFHVETRRVYHELALRRASVTG